MLDPWIIEEILRREEDRRREREHERVIPLEREAPYRDRQPRHVPEEERNRGVTIIDI